MKYLQEFRVFENNSPLLELSNNADVELIYKIRGLIEVGLILRRVNPCYSSFIGNLVYNEYDPIASSLEICRRGIGQFTKGFKLIPDFDLDNIITDKIDDYVNLNQVTGFVDLFKTILNKSYRRKDISFSSQKFSKYDKSHVCLCF